MSNPELRSSVRPVSQFVDRGPRDGSPLLPPPPAYATRMANMPPWMWFVLGLLGMGTAWWLTNSSILTRMRSDPAVTRKAAPESDSPLGMNVARRESGIEVQWDKNLPQVIEAQGGVLHIFDGSSHVELPLARSELMAGRVFYVPKEGDIDFRLTVFARSGAVHDALRVIHSPELTRPTFIARDDAGAAGRSSVPVERTASRRTVQLPPVQSAAATAARRNPPVTTASTAAANTETHTPAQAASEPARDSASRKADVPAAAPQASTAPVQQATAQLRPPTVASPVPSASAPAATNPPVETKAPAAPPPQTETRAVPGSASASPELIAQTPVHQPQPQIQQPVNRPEVAPSPVAAPPPRRVQPPVPLKQVTPVLPSQLKALIRSSTAVQVRMKISADGKVIAVEAPSASGVMNHVTEAAKVAARQWTFQPAMLDGKRVQSEHVVSFRFTR
jgi:hypothetical protein